MAGRLGLISCGVASCGGECEGLHAPTRPCGSFPLCPASHLLLRAAEGGGKGGHIQLDILVEVRAEQFQPQKLTGQFAPTIHLPARQFPTCHASTLALPLHSPRSPPPPALQAMGRQNFGCDTGNWDWKGLTSQNVTLNGGWGNVLCGVVSEAAEAACFGSRSVWVWAGQAEGGGDTPRLLTQRPAAIFTPSSIPHLRRQAAARLGGVPPAAG